MAIVISIINNVYYQYGRIIKYTIHSEETIHCRGVGSNLFHGRLPLRCEIGMTGSIIISPNLEHSGTSIGLSVSSGYFRILLNPAASNKPIKTGQLSSIVWLALGTAGKKFFNDGISGFLEDYPRRGSQLTLENIELIPWDSRYPMAGQGRIDRIFPPTHGVGGECNLVVISFRIK